MALIKPPEDQTIGQTEIEEGSTQDDYEKVVLAAMSVINEQSDQIVAMLQQVDDDPATALGQVSALIMGQLDEQTGGNIAEDVILPASAEILENVAELAGQAKLFDVTPDVLKNAGDILEMELAEIYGVDPQEVEDYTKENLSEDELSQMTGRFNDGSSAN